MVAKWKKLSDLRDKEITPMIRQFIQAKAEAEDSILFFRMGDFFEMFFEDAVEAAQILDLALTSRDGAGKKDGERIPMCGVPFRAVDGYVAKLIKHGKTVTICDQVEDPKQAKGIVKREVVRTITPGTVLEPELLDETSNNYLAALVLNGEMAGLAFVDVTTGEFLAAQVGENSGRTVIDELTRMGPVEVLVDENADDSALDDLKRRFDSIAFVSRPSDDFDTGFAQELLLEQFGLSTLKGIGLDEADEATSCAGAVLAYVKKNQRDAVPQLQFPRRYNPSGYVVLDGNTQRNLELTESLLDRRRHGTLLGVLDQTKTSMGGRKLRNWILHPLLNVEHIWARLGAVEAFVDNAELRLNMRDVLKEVSDLERLTGRITSKTGNGRDMKALGRSLMQTPLLRANLEPVDAALLVELRDDMDEMTDVVSWIESAIVDEPPLALSEGDIFKNGYDEELDRLRSLVRGGRDWIAALRKREIEKTGIQNLKVRFNKVFGYYIEVSKGNVHLVPDTYERKQTLVNAERYITPELKEREEEILGAQDRMQDMEYRLFGELRERVSGEARRIQQTADAIASVDVLLSLAEVAVAKNYSKPSVDESAVLTIRDGRHPVVEDLMQAGSFVPNDTHLDSTDAFLQIVTGPNMAGKSTYLRQVALIALMAQMGSFVPAAECQSGVMDRIFTRVGASDNLVRGESTFMVEMIETANILNTATDRSLIVLDEIGRGTSTFDGISIAWSVAEHLHDHLRAKTLFATHYHELTELATKLEHAKNVNVAVREWNGKVVFLYRIVDGGADHSYGIQVAKLAGLPNAVIGRAREILESLEAGNTDPLGTPMQMYLFGSQPQSKNELSKVEQELETIDPDELSPREAHDFLYHLKHLKNRPRTEN